MDVFEALEALHKESAVDTSRRPLGSSSETRNGVATSTRRGNSKTREVRSRYKSPTPVQSQPVTPKLRRSASPNVTRSTRSVNPLSGQLGSAKRAVSAERKRPSTPPSPSRPTTPVSDTSVESVSSSKKGTGSRLPEVLWPSTMRSLSVSFQSDSISIPVTKKDKPVSHSVSDRTLKPSLNVVTGSRKLTPERKRSPLKGKNTTHQSENSRPVDGSQARLIDQHRWPSRAGGKLSGNMITKSIDMSNYNGIPALRRLSADGVPRHLQRISGDPSLRRLSADGISRTSRKTYHDDSNSHRSEFEEHIGALGLRMKTVDDSLMRISGLQKEHALNSSEKASLANVSVRSRLMPGSRLPSPSRSVVSKGTPSPLKTRPSPQTPGGRGTSPSRVRQSSPTQQSSSAASVLSFVADIKKGKKSNQLEDAHQLRLLYNRQLQWRFANAQADASLFIQKITTEETLHNVWETNLELWDSVLRKRIELQRHNLDLKLNLVLREQMAYLEDWALLEEIHSSSLDGAIEDLEASTLRLPVTGGAKADIDSLKAAISSAADVMQTMGSSICSLLSKAEGMNGLVSELAEVAGYERAMLNECDTLLSSSAAMQVKEYSLQTQLIQSRQNSPNSRLPFFEETS